MLNILKEQIKDKNVLILGYGREGHFHSAPGSGSGRIFLRHRS